MGARYSVQQQQRYLDHYERLHRQRLQQQPQHPQPGNQTQHVNNNLNRGGPSGTELTRAASSPDLSRDRNPPFRGPRPPDDLGSTADNNGTPRPTSSDAALCGLVDELLAVLYSNAHIRNTSSEAKNVGVGGAANGLHTILLLRDGNVWSVTTISGDSEIDHTKHKHLTPESTLLTVPSPYCPSYPVVQSTPPPYSSATFNSSTQLPLPYYQPHPPTHPPGHQANLPPVQHNPSLQPNSLIRHLHQSLPSISPPISEELFMQLPQWRTSFPNQLGPFHVVPSGVCFHSVIPDICAYEVEAECLLQALTSLYPKSASQTLHLQARSRTSIYAVSEASGDLEAVSTVGSTSPWNVLTSEHARVLPPQIRQRAASFAWCYPLPGFAQLMSSEPDTSSESCDCTASDIKDPTGKEGKSPSRLRFESIIAFASVGGFVYTDVRGQVLYSVTIGKPSLDTCLQQQETSVEVPSSTVPISPEPDSSLPTEQTKSAHTVVMEFGAAHPWSSNLTEVLWKQGRFQQVSIKELFDAGARHFCWIRPGERIGSESNGMEGLAWPHGAFAYLFGDDPFLDDPRNCCFPVQPATHNHQCRGRSMSSPTHLRHDSKETAVNDKLHNKVIKFSNFTVVPHTFRNMIHQKPPTDMHTVPRPTPLAHAQPQPPPLVLQTRDIPIPTAPREPIPQPAEHTSQPQPIERHAPLQIPRSRTPPPVSSLSISPPLNGTSLDTSGGLTDRMMRDLEASITVCTACGLRRREVLCHPCLHFALCSECSLTRSSCPICKTHIANVVNLLS
ncbi:hypothetical protein Pelo_11894 [Pelomyxa schiedti]|nr:hypothetical protein Pelo_11894 [Pelomyxa schiedti]